MLNVLSAISVVREKKAVIATLIGGGLIALFWLIWHLIAGQVPSVMDVKMLPKVREQLPIIFSRWWDIPAMIIWLNFIMILGRYVNKREDDGDIDLCMMGLGVLFGMIFGVVSIFLGLFFPLQLGFSIVVCMTLFSEQYVASGLALGLGSIIGMQYGLILGLAIAITLMLITVAPIIIVENIKLFRKGSTTIMLTATNS